MSWGECGAYKLVLGKGGEAMKLQHTFSGLAAPLEAFVSMGESLATDAPIVHLVHNWNELGAKLHVGRFSQLAHQCFAAEDVARFQSNFASEDLLKCSQSAAMATGTPRAQQGMLQPVVPAVLCAEAALVAPPAGSMSVPEFVEEEAVG